jgi:hypothetical protein
MPAGCTGMPPLWDVSATGRNPNLEHSSKVFALTASPVDAQERVPPPEGMFWRGKLLLDRASIPARIFEECSKFEATKQHFLSSHKGTTAPRIVRLCNNAEPGSRQTAFWADYLPALRLTGRSRSCRTTCRRVGPTGRRLISAN